ncbi:hypothetical protein GCM10025867_13060 [Frondihabitans sucicola]|uniref:Tfp pilus assembly protein PilO n=1 Tax=Frondihabitans sucicola TaxID=1268041 RepID=A0ABM8GKX5_9MICO|nr:hypothetical protein [Frondihabitans sucicola]BDZ49065.1 hypothetical protein GCM10025867_13060 [Frondihabitans sucicola]
MDRNKILMFVAVLAMFVVAGAGFLVGVQPQLQAADAAKAQTATTNQNNSALATGVATLRSQFSKIDSLTTQLASLTASVPADAASSTLIDEYNDIAKATDTTIVNLTFADAQAYTEPVATTSAGVAAAPKSVTSSLITPTNFSAIPVTIQIKGVTPRRSTS